MRLRPGAGPEMLGRGPSTEAPGQARQPTHSQGDAASSVPMESRPKSGTPESTKGEGEIRRERRGDWEVEWRWQDERDE